MRTILVEFLPLYIAQTLTCRNPAAAYHQHKDLLKKYIKIILLYTNISLYQTRDYNNNNNNNNNIYIYCLRIYIYILYNWRVLLIIFYWLFWYFSITWVFTFVFLSSVQNAVQNKRGVHIFCKYIQANF